MDDSANTVEVLARRLAELEHRVAALERPTERQPFPLVSPLNSSSPPNATTLSSPPQEFGLLSLLGIAMLMIAVAYLLRAAMSYTAIPRIPVVVLAVAYAFASLIPAARTKAQNRLPSLIWAGTSVIIFLPMIWELTQRFRFLPDALAASLLGLYAIVAAALGWNHHSEEIAWVTAGSTSIASLVLAVATHDLVPFVAVLLVIAAVGEIEAARQRKLQVRPLVALIADVAVFALILIYSGPAASRAVYPTVSPLLLLIAAPLLLFLYAGSASTQTILLRRGISVFETAQTLIAFALTCGSFLAFWSGRTATILGVLCLISAVGGYVVSFAWFDRLHAERNYHVYATGSLVLLLAGCLLSLPGMWMTICLAAFAVAASITAPLIRHPSLEFHGISALIVMAAASGLLLWSAKAIAGPFPGAPGGTITLAVAAAVVCSIASLRCSSMLRWNRVLIVASTAVGIFALAGILVWTVVWFGTLLHTAPFTPGPQHVAVIRTLVICVFALGLAWSGSKWQRRELAWLAWTVLALGAVKLVFEDMLHGHLAFTATSIFLYAVTLLLVPRLIRTRAKTENS